MRISSPVPQSTLTLTAMGRVVGHSALAAVATAPVGSTGSHPMHPSRSCAAPTSRFLRLRGSQHTRQRNLASCNLVGVAAAAVVPA